MRQDGGRVRRMGERVRQKGGRDNTERKGHGEKENEREGVRDRRMKQCELDRDGKTEERKGEI